MVLDALGDALRNTLRKIAGASHISPELIKELVKDIQRALIQSDVNVRLALELSKTIENRALEEKAPAGMTGREHVVRIVHQELVKAIGESRSLKLGPQKIMLVGLYGLGKTTTTGKLGKHFKKKGLSLMEKTFNGLIQYMEKMFILTKMFLAKMEKLRIRRAI